MNSQKKLTNSSSKKADLNNFSTNSQINRSNKAYINNMKKSINLKNPKLANQNPIKYISNNSTNMNSNNKINCLTNKYKTTKNSPNKLFKKENPKSLKYLNKKSTKKNMGSNDSKKNNKLNSKASINNSTNANKNINVNNNNKIIIINKKSNEKVLIEEIFKKKLAKKKNKKSVTTKNSNNNSINLSNTSYRNMQINASDIIIPRLKFNNFNNGNKFQKIKEHLAYMRDDSKEKNINRDNINFTNFMTNSIMLKNINSYRDKDSLKRVNAISEKHFGDKKNNFYGQTSKDFYIIKKYISSVLTNQPQRKQKSHFSKTRKYNTITNKKILNKYEKERNIVSTSRKHNIKNKISINKKIEVNSKNKINNKHVNGDYTIFVKSNFHLKNVSKMSNPTKQHSQKESVEKIIKNEDKELKVKTIQKKAGMPIRLSNDNNNNNNNNIKATSKSISTNNYSYQNSEIFNKSNNFNNKKVDIDYHFVYNNYILNNKKGLQQNFKNMKKKIYSTKSSKEKMNNNKILQKKNCLDKLFKKFKKNNSNYRSNNYSKDELAYKRNLSYRLKTPRQIMNKNKKINVNKNKNIFGIKIKNIKCMKNNPKLKNNYLNHKNKKNNKISEKNSGSNSKAEISTKNSFVKNKEMSKSNKINQIIQKKLENINEENNNEIINEKSNKIEDDFIENKEIKIEEEKNDENKENESENNKKKKIPDKDLSDVEEDNTLLDYLNNNIDINLTNNDTSILNESYESMNSNLRDNNKYFSFNKSKEIISKYIKQYYIKHKKYPKTKMKFYKYGRLLGRGAYGKVNLCLHTLTGRLVAIKSINKSKITKERQREKIKIETSIMKSLSYSNNIVKILESYETKKHICIVMEYICAGDLLSYIKKRSKLTEPVAKFIFRQIILALQYIHSHNIVHRDIKLDNILIDLDNNIKICDFGVSKIIKKGDIMIEQCGTPAYIAPEILKNKGYEGFGVDIWSAGVVLYAMLSGTVPFKGGDLKELHKLIIEGDFKPIKNISKEANHLVKCLLEVDPKSRITTEDILVHPWMINIDLNFFRTQNLFTNAEHILLAKSNVDYSDINNKENMVENFDIKNLDTEEDNLNINIKTKSIILAPFNSSVSIDKEDEDDDYYEDEYSNSKEKTDFNNPDLIIRNGIIKFAPKTKDLNRNYELNNNKEIDNGIVILSYDSDEKVKKEKSPYDGSYNSKINSRKFSPRGEMENNVNNKDNKNNGDKENNVVNKKILDKILILGYDKEYVKHCLHKKEFNYATATYRLLDKYFCA